MSAHFLLIFINTSALRSTVKRNKMKKVLLLLAMGLMSFNTFAQRQVTIKAGTIVPLQSVRQVKVRTKAWCLNAFALTLILQ